MSDSVSRRGFAALAAGAVIGSEALAQEKPKAEPAKGPVEGAFERDYTPPKFKPSWKKPQTNRQFVQDFVITLLRQRNAGLTGCPEVTQNRPARAGFFLL